MDSHRPVVMQRCANGTTRDQASAPSALSAGRSGGVLHRSLCAGGEALWQRRSRDFRRHLRLRTRNTARQADADKIAFNVRGLRFAWDHPEGRKLTPALPSLGRDHSPLHGCSFGRLSELRRAGHHGLHALVDGRRWLDGVGGIRSGYGASTPRAHNRATGQRSRVLARQLHLGASDSPKQEPALAACYRLEWQEPACVGLGGRTWPPLLHADAQAQSWLARRTRAHRGNSQSRAGHLTFQSALAAGGWA